MTDILVVDDDPGIRTMFERTLAPLGDVVAAGTGAEALRLLATKKFSIVLLDLHLPVINGFVILRTLAAKPGPNRDTPVYVVTADTSDEARRRALQEHAAFVVTKPVPLTTLRALVETALKKLTAPSSTPPSAGRSPSPMPGSRSVSPPPASKPTPAPYSVKPTPVPYSVKPTPMPYSVKPTPMPFSTKPSPPPPSSLPPISPAPSSAPPGSRKPEK